MAFLFALATVSFALTDIAIGHLDLFPQMIREGTFDQILVRPLPSLFQVVASDFAVRRVGKVLQGLAVLVYALVVVEVDWTVGRALAIPLAIVRRRAHLRRGLGGARNDRLLDRGRDRVRERVHVRRELPVAVPDRDLRALAARPRRVPRARRVRRVLPGAVRARQGGRAGAAGGAAVPLAARSPCSRRSSPRAVWRNAVRHYRSAGG